jgi:hypothetical protein
MELRDGKAVDETPCFADSFEAPAWRSQWVQPTAPQTLTIITCCPCTDRTSSRTLQTDAPY